MTWSGAGDAKIRDRYQVGAARWAPSYVVRLDGERASSRCARSSPGLRRGLARCAARLSTASPSGSRSSPSSTRSGLGRRQQEPAKPGFRAPPVGAAALYADYERGLPRAAVVRTEADDAARACARDGRTLRRARRSRRPRRARRREWEEGSSRAKDAFEPTSLRDDAAAMQMAQALRARRRDEAAIRCGCREEVALGRGGGGGGTEGLRDRPPGSNTQQHADGGAALAVARSVRARRSRRLGDHDRGRGHDGHARWCRCPCAGLHRRLDARVRLRVRKDGRCRYRVRRRVAFDRGDLEASTAKLRHVTVPREQADVFRMAANREPQSCPLLPGPIDSTTTCGFSSPARSITRRRARPSDRDRRRCGGQVARHHDTARNERHCCAVDCGVHHAVMIDVENLSGRAIEIEVREPDPVARGRRR